MPRQNRVTPWGEINAVPDRGMFMGNRGTRWLSYLRENSK